MNSVTMAAAVHEAAHAVAARKQNVGVVHAVAAEKNCEVRTCWRRPRTMAEAIDAHEALAIVDLSGPAAEQCYLDQTRRDAEWRTDERNASCRAAAIIRLRLGLAEDAELTTAERAEADALLADLRDRAQVLVEARGPAIKRVAAALAAGRPLAQDEIDAAIAG